MAIVKNDNQAHERNVGDRLQCNFDNKWIGYCCVVCKMLWLTREPSLLPAPPLAERGPCIEADEEIDHRVQSSQG